MEKSKHYYKILLDQKYYNTVNEEVDIEKDKCKI